MPRHPVLRFPPPLLLMLLAAAFLHPVPRAIAARGLDKILGRPAKTVDDRLAGFGAAADARWRPFFARAGAPYPPASATFAVFTDTKELVVYAPGHDGRPRRIRALPILAASGGPGPKLREGDHQVPEGVYAVESLNPNSLYHVALRVNYPNADDRARARADGRTKLGGDIMIHGKACSIGCLAMGDPGAEDLFTLAARTGGANLTLLLCPVDFRIRPDYAPPSDAPAWTTQRYAALRAALAKLP